MKGKENFPRPFPRVPPPVSPARFFPPPNCRRPFFSKKARNGGPSTIETHFVPPLRGGAFPPPRYPPGNPWGAPKKRVGGGGVCPPLSQPPRGAPFFFFVFQHTPWLNFSPPPDQKAPPLSQKTPLPGSPPPDSSRPQVFCEEKPRGGFFFLPKPIPRGGPVFLVCPGPRSKQPFVGPPGGGVFFLLPPPNAKKFSPFPPPPGRFNKQRHQKKNKKRAPPKAPPPPTGPPPNKRPSRSPTYLVFLIGGWVFFPPRPPLICKGGAGF